MALKNSNAKQSNETKKTKVFLVDRHVCNFIRDEWMKDIESFRKWGKQHGVHEAIARKINEKEGYKIPVSTLNTICFYKQIKVSDFFVMLEKKYGNAQDKYYYVEK